MIYLTLSRVDLVSILGNHRTLIYSFSQNSICKACKSSHKSQSEIKQITPAMSTQIYNTVYLIILPNTEIKIKNNLCFRDEYGVNRLVSSGLTQAFTLCG